MKKNIFLSILALASMLFATSCSQDELINESTNGDFVNATFTIGTADGMGTRAVGDGTTVDKVACAVYDAFNNEELSALRQDVAITNKTATFSVRLAKGKNYRVAFFAYNEEADAYDVTDLKSIKVNGNQLSNVEGRDAFTAYVDVTEGETMNAFTKEVTLKRPFAQLNLGIDDAEFAEAANAGLTVAKSKIVVSNVYNEFSAFDNDVAENAVEGSMTFELNAIPTEKLKVTVNGEERFYNYLALNYLLVGDNDTEKTLTDIKFTWESNNGDSNAGSVTEFLNIPVQRNYRTNIVGKLLTSPTIFNIIIDEEFEGEKNDGRIFNATDLQAALDAAPENATTVITLGANIEANVTDIQKPGRKVVIDGRGYKYNGTIKVHSNSNYYADAALTIKNLNFETSAASVNFIEALENGSERYSSNITVENCTFTATGEAVNTAVGVQIKASKNAKVIGCTATDVHSLIQAQSCDESVLVQNCTVNGKNGVAFKQVKNAVVEGTTITANAYGIRFDGNTDNYGITVKDNNVTATQPFIVRKMTGQNNTITLEGTNTLTTEAKYQIVITNGSDDETYVEPTGTYTLTGADNFVVYPRDVVVSNWAEFTAALAANKASFLLAEDITYDANYQLQKDVVINLNGKSMTLPMINIHNKVTIKNGTINGKVYARKNSNITFENITFSGAISDNLSTEGHLAIQSGCTLYAKDCLFSPTSVSGSQTKPVSFEGGSSNMKFEGCEFKSSPYKKQVYFNSLSATAKLDFTNCNFNNKTPNIMFAAACPLTNLTMSGTTMLGSVTLETNRAKDAVTAEDLAYLRESLIANNSMSRVRLFYADGSDEYIN